ncbi:hypothetical protein SCP_0115970 [Sparassis crispa]|uniref:Uncharacterized protein n=1 Tax=Sparassis crispa TaxID=139825 RepID=A0A401G946_9APHY|nr:hypothetical protein SCP_0115970 [Sparassis crispa]GBE78706.1 hypothetical protein SCP_0115970 [Sparassis crispa]
MLEGLFFILVLKLTVFDEPIESRLKDRIDLNAFVLREFLRWNTSKSKVDGMIAS